MTVRFEADSEAAAHRVEAWCGEPLLHEGEDIAVALASGTVRRQALEAALAEMERGLPEPSFEWRRDYSLVLGSAILYATLVTAFNLLVDLAYAWLDPRVRSSL